MESLAVADGFAQFKLPLPGGGMFYAAWPKSATAEDLSMAKAMLGASLQRWIDRPRSDAGEAEYASWFPVRSGSGESNG